MGPAENPDSCDLDPDLDRHPADIVLVTLDDAELTAGLRALQGAAATSGARLVVVDLSRLRTLSSPTVTALLLAQHRCAGQSRAVVLRGVTRRRLRSLRRAGLTGVFALEQRSEVAS